MKRRNYVSDKSRQDSAQKEQLTYVPDVRCKALREIVLFDANGKPEELVVFDEELTGTTHASSLSRFPVFGALDLDGRS